jgi:hypothetical protein
MTRDDANGPTPNRRRYPRLEVDGVVELLNITLGVTLDVRDIGLGGFQAVSPRLVQPGDEHVLRISLPGDIPRELRVTAIHCRPKTAATPPFLVGWQFAQDAMTARHVVAILDHLTHVDALELPGVASGSKV